MLVSAQPNRTSFEGATCDFACSSSPAPCIVVSAIGRGASHQGLTMQPAAANTLWKQLVSRVYSWVQLALRQWLQQGVGEVVAMHEDTHWMWCCSASGRLLRQALPARRAQVHAAVCIAGAHACCGMLYMHSRFCMPLGTQCDAAYTACSMLAMHKLLNAPIFGSTIAGGPICLGPGSLSFILYCLNSLV